MNDYYDVRIDISPCSEDACDLMAAILADEGYESFTSDAEGMNAFVPARLFSEEALERAITAHPMNLLITAKPSLVEGQDWNSEWEKNYFKPIVVDDKCVIHSSFHTDIPKCRYDIVIDPKMAFGTGHHSTTSLIIRRLLDADLDGKSLIDVGTGTGILAILARMRGAAPVVGIEIDPVAYENACENIELNNCGDIQLICGDASALAEIAPADMLVANINRNIVCADLNRYAQALKPGGVILLSGFYTSDIPIVSEAVISAGLAPADFTEDNDWACLKATKPQN